VATQAQIEANRKNAQKSTGPKTPEGKSRIRKNALWHGITGNDEALTPELLQAATEYWDDLVCDYQPEGRHQRYLVSQAAIAMARLDVLTILQEQHRVKDQRRAATAWHEDRSSDAGRIAEQLKKKPSRTVERLSQTAHGAAWAITRWRTLQGTLERGEAWSEAQRETAQALLGLDPELLTTSSRIGEETPVERLKELTARELERWTTLKRETLDPLDELDRELAVLGAAFADSPAARRFQRYERNCHKKRKEALAELAEVKERRKLWDDGADWANAEHDKPSWSNALTRYLEGLAELHEEPSAEETETPEPVLTPSEPPKAEPEPAAEAPKPAPKPAAEPVVEKQSQSTQTPERKPFTARIPTRTREDLLADLFPPAPKPPADPPKPLSKRERRRLKREAKRRAEREAANSSR